MNIKVLILSLAGLALLVWLATKIATPSRYSSLLTRDRSTAGTNTFSHIEEQDCEDFALILSSTRLAKRMNRSKDWVATYYRVELTADTSFSKRRVIGHTNPGSACYIIRQDGNWFYLQSPESNELGWLHKRYIAGFMKMDPHTLLPCPGSER